MMEPAETESIEVLDGFLDALQKIMAEAHSAPETVKSAPHNLAVRRLDEISTEREPDLCYTGTRRT